MNKSLMEILVDPVSKTPLSLVEREPMDGQVVIEGALRGPEGRAYVITNGIPRFVLTEDQGQKQTEASFGFKWGQRQTYDSPERLGTFRDWLLEPGEFGSSIPRLLESIYQSRPDVAAAIPGGERENAKALLAWAIARLSHLLRRATRAARAACSAARRASRTPSRWSSR